MLNWMKGNDFLEEAECAVTSLGMGEIGDRAIARPGDDRHEKNPSYNCSFDPVHHEEGSEDSSAEDTKPHGRVAHCS